MGVAASITDDNHVDDDKNLSNISNNHHHSDLKPPAIIVGSSITESSCNDQKIDLNNYYNSKSHDTEEEKSDRSRFGSKHQDPFNVGDVISIYSNTRGDIEGLVIERLENNVLSVDFGEGAKRVSSEKCKLVLKYSEYEVGDLVELRPDGFSLYFSGNVVSVNSDNTLDVQMEGDDEDDIERCVEKANVRKIMSKRDIAVIRWRKSFVYVQSANAFMTPTHANNSLKQQQAISPTGQQEVTPRSNAGSSRRSSVQHDPLNEDLNEDDNNDIKIYYNTSKK
eukprot:gene12072-16153_t